MIDGWVGLCDKKIQRVFKVFPDPSQLVFSVEIFAEKIRKEFNGIYCYRQFKSIKIFGLFWARFLCHLLAQHLYNIL